MLRGQLVESWTPFACKAGNSCWCHLLRAVTANNSWKKKEKNTRGKWKRIKVCVNALIVSGKLCGAFSRQLTACPVCRSLCHKLLGREISKKQPTVSETRRSQGCMEILRYHCVHAECVE